MGKTLSDYQSRNYSTLHIKAETHRRLSLVKAKMQARDNKFISQDAFVNVLIDSYVEAGEPEPVAELA